MLILNTFTILLQVAFIVFMSLISMNIIRHFTSAKKMALIAPALFVNHGGGPLPLLGDKDHAGLTNFLRDGVKKHVDFKNVKAIILVTAHWEENKVTISSGNHHDLYFDYYGFPPESYKYKYDAPGDPKLASRIHDALKKSGIDSRLDSSRGWDHGVFVPMLLINPEANIPLIQISVLSNQDPEQHYKLGQALQQFRKEGIAVIGSGMSYHNMREFFNSRRAGRVINKEFDDYLTDVCTADEQKRKEGLIAWRKAAGASDAHPPHAAEHFMPLVVVAGAGGSKPGERIFNWDMNDETKMTVPVMDKEPIMNISAFKGVKCCAFFGTYNVIVFELRTKCPSLVPVSLKCPTLVPSPYIKNSFLGKGIYANEDLIHARTLNLTKN